MALITGIIKYSSTLYVVKYVFMHLASGGQPMKKGKADDPHNTYYVDCIFEHMVEIGPNHQIYYPSTATVITMNLFISASYNPHSYNALL